jgi:hypothetical protein
MADSPVRHHPNICDPIEVLVVPGGLSTLEINVQGKKKRLPKQPFF